MITLWIRLLRNDRHNRMTLVVATIAVATAALLLTLIAGLAAAVEVRSARVGWREFYSANVVPQGEGDAAWSVVEDSFEGRRLLRLDVAPLSPQPPVIPGIARYPEPGTAWVSPALRRLLETTSPDLLGRRFPKIVGVMGPDGLADPSELVAIVGHEADLLRRLGGRDIEAGRVTPRRPQGALLQVSAGVLMLAVLTPLAMLVASATRLAATRRERMLSIIRLIGADRRFVGRLIALEAICAGLVGTGVGCLGAILLRRTVARLTLLEYRFFPDDLAPSALSWALIAVGTPLATVAGAWVGMRRMKLSPLSVVRRERTKSPPSWRLLPLAAGLLLFSLVTGAAFGGGLPGMEAPLVAVAFLAVLVAFAIAAPWVVTAIGRVLVRLGVTGIMAGRRLIHDPHVASRLAIAVALATLAGSLFYTMVPGLESQVVADRPSAGLRQGVLQVSLPSVVGVPNVAPVLGWHLSEMPEVLDFTATATVLATSSLGTEYVVLLGEPCELATWALAVNMEDGCVDATIAVNSDVIVPPDRLSLLGPSVDTESPRAQTGLVEISEPGVRFAADRRMLSVDLIIDPRVVLDAGRGFYTDSLYVRFAGGTEIIEGIRTLVMSLLPTAVAMTASEAAERTLAPFREVRGPLDGLILAALIIAGLSASITAATALLERRQQFMFLRVVGLPMTLVRRVYAVEAALPTAASIWTGALVGVIVGRLLLSMGGVSSPVLMNRRGALLLIVSTLAAILVALAPVLSFRRQTEPTSLRLE
jgi:hypothetical protein